MRIISWNIRAGGGVRSAAISDQLRQWKPDVAALSEFRDTEPSRLIAESLRLDGLHYQHTTVDPVNPSVNSLLVASRWPVRRIKLARAPANERRWLHVNVSSPIPFAVLALHIPNRSTGNKYPFMDAVVDVVEQWRGHPAILMGDTNSGRMDIDEESPAFNRHEDSWMTKIESLKWRDAFRLLHQQKQEYTWYSPNGRNGFRLDQMFLHPKFACRASGFCHLWGGLPAERRDRLSDHCALILDLAEQ